MVSRIKTIAFIGIESINIDVEAHIANGIPNFHIVGLPDKAIAESKERIRAAFQNLGLAMSKRIVVNLSPADLYKAGNHYDLAITTALMVEFGIIEQSDIENYIVMGEISLDGSINGVNGVLPAAIYANTQKMGVICPKSNGVEGAWSGNNNILATSHITEIINHFKGHQLIEKPKTNVKTINDSALDLADIKGQAVAKRALEIAAAGNHNMLLVGAPGSGKSMLAKRITSILPKQTPEEVLDSCIINSINGDFDLKKGINIARPFRSPHCSSSMAAMVGGGKNAKPGEVTLANGGILFLDELPEFSRNVLEALRQPLEEKKISIARVNAHITYPAKFQLIAAMNPCKCGYYGNPSQECSRAPKCVEDYQSKLSGPLLDRFDLWVQMSNVDPMLIANDIPEEKSKDAATRVKAAKKLQQDRFKGLSISNNAEADGELLTKICALDDKCIDFLRKASIKYKFSMRRINRMMRVSRTIADLAGKDKVGLQELKEALNFRINKS